MAKPFIGLTGGIGAGKSEALAAFRRLGAATISSDEVVHELLADDDVRDLLVDRWGEGIAPGGKVDRGRIAELVFESPAELRWLEHLLHPRVAERIVAWRAALPAEVSLAVVEVPLLFEVGMEDVFDAVVCVVADDEAREKRAMAQGLEGLAARGTRQLSQDEKAARATHVVRNDGTLDELEGRIAALFAELQTMPARR